MNYLFESKFFSLDLKFYEKLVTMATRKMPIIPTKYPKSADQISGGIWSVNETSFTGFEVDQYKHSFGHNSVDLQRIVTKFAKVNLLVKNFHMQIWLLR